MKFSSRHKKEREFSCNQLEFEWTKTMITAIVKVQKIQSIKKNFRFVKFKKLSDPLRKWCWCTILNLLKNLWSIFAIFYYLGNGIRHMTKNPKPNCVLQSTIVNSNRTGGECVERGETEKVNWWEKKWKVALFNDRSYLYLHVHTHSIKECLSESVFHPFSFMAPCHFSMCSMALCGWSFLLASGEIYSEYRYRY